MAYRAQPGFDNILLGPEDEIITPDQIMDVADYIASIAFILDELLSDLMGDRPRA